MTKFGQELSVSAPLETDNYFNYYILDMKHVFISGKGVFYESLYSGLHEPGIKHIEQELTDDYVRTIIDEYAEHIGETKFRGMILRPHETQVIPETLKSILYLGKEKVKNVLIKRANKIVLPYERQMKAPI